MNWKKSKHIRVLCLICVGVLAFTGYKRLSCKNPVYRVEVVEIETDKYGYKIVRDEQVVICQLFVPGLPERKAFLSTNDANRVGELVRERLEAGENFSISVDDLKRLRINTFAE